MNQTLPTADLNTAGTTDVIPSVAIDRIIAQRNEGIALFMQAMECLVRIFMKGDHSITSIEIG
ncbi:TPA: hypothetical protein OC096_003845 [Escherichia coli]|nr:hypothetical protein [Escherichia coli]